MKVVKAGCFLVNKSNGFVALIYREKQKDFSFPKGHLEGNESIIDCAIRETEEETKRCVEIRTDFEPLVEKYVTPRGEDCECYMFTAVDKGPSDNACSDTHQVIWTAFEKVEQTLSYPSLKNSWNAVRNNIEKILNE